MRDSETPRFIGAFRLTEIPLLHRESEIHREKIVKKKKG
jgi:hypothetical protein